MNLPASTIHPFPPRHQVGKSWPEIADVFAGRADRERKLAWEWLSWGCQSQFQRHMLKAETLDEAAAFCRVQKAAGHRDPSTTKLYDRRGYNPEKAASFFATY